MREFQQPFDVQEVRYDFGQLKDWKDLALDLFAGHRMVTLDIRESNNRLEIGVDTENGIEGLRTALMARGLPEDAFSIEVSTPVSYDIDLNDLTFPTPGGMGMYARGTYGPLGPCSIGANVTKDNQLGFFVTAAHCSQRIGGLGDPTFGWPDAFHQPDQGSASMGREELDTPVSPFAGCPSPYDCRHADVLLGRYGQWFRADGFEIALPGSSPNTGSTQFFDTKEVKFAWGETWVLAPPTEGWELDMVGRVSGWTSGELNQACIATTAYRDYPYNSGTQIVYPCGHTGTYNSAGGDSGGPVFTYQETTDDIIFYGIHSGRLNGFAFWTDWFGARIDFGVWDWGSRNGGTNVLVSSSNQGTSAVPAPYPSPPGPPTPLSVTIVGPSEVPEQTTAWWSASTTGGAGPLSYEWRWNGQVVGSGQQLGRNSGPPGTVSLQVTVSDFDGSDSDSRQIEVTAWIGCEEEPCN